MTPARASSVSSPLTVSTTRTSTPPNSTDLSRPRLKQIAKLIRDELDLRVAREGPDVLRPDDVLNLHEIFVALRHAQSITVSDLRATGIHKAVQDIAGVATRWPSRLCDDCDRIIEIWSVKFGSFGEIHPFLYGRGGRLEGIASVHEQSREALLKRWAETCPDKIHPKRSHKLGDLGFVAGTWWLNALFAHHAGIIGLEACDGGTTYDKHGAYALLLKDTGEVEASSESSFTYRISQKDKGKFRLTSATPKSRDPVRILRSHSINSVWGPKAGVRYDGLYSVKGWSIKQAKNTDVAGGQWKEGDILFDVKFERVDRTPMEFVTQRPTATEVDDYAEYKRLRKLSRSGKQKEPSAPLDRSDLQAAVKAAPPIMPLQPPLVPLKPLIPDSPPSALRKGMTRRLHFDEEAHVHLVEDGGVVSPKTVPNTDPLQIAAMGKSNTLAVPQQPNRVNTHGKVDIASNEPGGRASPAGSNASSAHTTQTAASTIPDINIREVAPWIDYDADLTMPSPSEQPPIIHQRPIITQTIARTDSIKGRSSKSLQAKSRDSLQSPRETTSLFSTTEPDSEGRQEERTDGDPKSTLGDVLSPQNTMKKDKRKSVFVRSRNPMAKLFDGILDDETDESIRETRTDSLSAEPTTPRLNLRERANSLGEIPQLDSQDPLEPFSPESPFNMARRNAICPANETTHNLPATIAPDITDTPVVIAVPHEDPFIETPAPRRPRALPMSMKNLISQSSLATSINSATCTPVPDRLASPLGQLDEESLAEARLRKMVERLRGLNVKVPFKDPFGSSPGTRGRKWGEGSNKEVAPGEVAAQL